MTPVYASDGSPEFNERLHQSLVNIADHVQKALEENLVALILGGGYGRGEGGVVQRDSIEYPYNDLDFTLMVRNKSRVNWDGLRAISDSFAAQLHIHVDFSRPLTVADVEHWPQWLMWYDLLNGHVVLKGTQDILIEHAPAVLKEPLPAIEGTRLLLNRGTGLLWALRVLRGSEPEPDEDFVRRNYYKCGLALGDALLIAHQRYTTPYRGRDALLKALAQAAPEVAAFGLQTVYEEALLFKFRPDRVDSRIPTEQDVQTLAKVWGSVLLHVEGIRTGSSWVSLSAYTQWNGIREMDQHRPARLIRNIIRNVQLGRLSWRYPREELYGRLPVLLGLVDAPVRDWNRETESYLRIWNGFN